MFRHVLGAIGIVDLLVPERFIESAERVALKNPDECKRKSWVVPFARLEGVGYLVLAWRAGRAYSAFKKTLGVIGLFIVLYPRRFIDSMTAIGYEDSCEWQSWVYPLCRAVGFIYVLLALDELRKD
ncbi:hypothetical protein [Haladaptatus sp. DFWS20]|uniref:hypothetical protein n=1 Tax=Haladaptatus sp. DFWS20 TaxID=3403467 RepID=UPI003EB8C356